MLLFIGLTLSAISYCYLARVAYAQHATIGRLRAERDDARLMLAEAQGLDPRGTGTEAIQ